MENNDMQNNTRKNIKYSYKNKLKTKSINKSKFTLQMVTVKNVLIILSVTFMANPVFADGRSLESVATNLGDKAITVARAFVLFGFAVGSILCFIPWTRHWGIEVLKTSGFGSLIVYGAPALIDFVRSAF